MKRQATSFADLMAQAAAEMKLRLCGPSIEPLAHLDYPRELQLKEKAWRRFCEEIGVAMVPDAILPAPRPRRYRTTSKRRVIAGRHGLFLAFTDGTGRGGHASAAESLLEPAAHADIFRLAAAILARQSDDRIAQSLSYIIVRGSYREFALVFNAHSLDRHVVAKLKDVASELQGAGMGLLSAFLYFDPSRSPYYMELERPQGAFRMKKFFGPDHFLLKAAGKTFGVPLVSFSQVNEAILDGMLAKFDEILAGERERLLDLYCGYGLFSCTMDGYRQVIGLDAGAESIAAAIVNGRKIQRPGTRFLFRRHHISHGNISALLPRSMTGTREDAILDPPRGGVDPATLRAIASRRPQRVIHVFCSVDEIPAALAVWRNCRYLPRRIVALDMFAGTFGLEVMVLLEQGQGGHQK